LRLPNGNHGIQASKGFAQLSDLITIQVKAPRQDIPNLISASDAVEIVQRAYNIPVSYINIRMSGKDSDYMVSLVGNFFCAFHLAASLSFSNI
jgi:hypothetical protein